MGRVTQTRKIIVFGIDNLFGEEVVSGLAADGNCLMLCGENRARHRKLIDQFPGYVKGVCSRENPDYYKQVQVMIESLGSLDAVIYLINPVSVNSFFQQSEKEVRETFDRNLIEPVLMLKAIFPYLKKSTRCKVIFVDTSAFIPGAMNSEVQDASTMGVCGFSAAIHHEFAERGVDIRAITSPDQLNKDSDALSSAEPAMIAYGSRVTEKIQDVMRSASAIHSVGNVTPSRSVSPTIH